MKKSLRKFLFLIITLIGGSLIFTSCQAEIEKVSANKSTSPKTKQQNSNIVENKLSNNNSTAANEISNSQSNRSNQPVEPDKCQLKNAPVLKGFFIGQTVDEIDQRIPGFKDAYQKEKELSRSIDKKANFVLMTSGTLIQTNGDGETKDIKDFSLIWHFLDDKIMAVVVKYLKNDSTDLKSFLSKMSNEYNLPSDGWKIDKEEAADLNCTNFRINVSINPQNSPSIMLIDSMAEKEKENRNK